MWNSIGSGKEYGSIDVCKLIMAFVVIFAHTNPIVNISNTVIIELVNMIEESVVPFFFVASGFFLCLGMQFFDSSTEARLKKYLSKIFTMYCAWTIISLPVTIYGYYISGDDIFHCILSYIKYFLFVGKLYNAYQLWYLLSLIYALVTILFFVKRKVSLKKITFIAVVFFCTNEIMLWGSKAQGLPDIVDKFIKGYQFVFNKGGIFTGMAYVCIGIIIAQKRKYLKTVYCVIGFVLINIIQIWGTYSHIGNVLSIIEAMLFFMFLLNIDLLKRDIYLKCRKASTIIYFSHLIFFSLYTIVLIDDPNKLGMDSFLVTTVLTCINVIVLMKMSENNRFKWIKKII